MLCGVVSKEGLRGDEDPRTPITNHLNNEETKQTGEIILFIASLTTRFLLREYNVLTCIGRRSCKLR